MTHHIARFLGQWRLVWEREGKLAFLRRLLGPLLTVSYRAWIARSEPDASQLERQRVEAQGLSYRPLLTVVICAGKTPPTPTSIDASIRSVVNQSYDRWELLLAGGPLQRRDAGHLGDAWAERDARIRVDRARAHPPGASRNGDGEFVLPLGAGDAVAPHALFEVARLLNDHRGTEIVYFDEDRLSPDGTTRSSPFFKPGWSPEMLLSVNYLAHATIKRTLLDAVGPASDLRSVPWDLALRCAERAQEIRHIAKVLYHARAAAPPEPPGLEDLRALAAHCRRLGIAGASAALVPPGVVRLTWPTADHAISIIIPNKDRVPLLRRCITSLLAQTGAAHLEMLIVDTGSTDIATRQYYASLASRPGIRIVDLPGPFNYSAANNAGVRAATGDLLLFLNNDTEALHPDCLEEMVRWAERREVGAVGAKLLYPDNTIQHAGIVIGLRGLAHHVYRHTRGAHADLFGSVDWYRNYLAVTGACLMTRREVFDEVGGFDEAYQIAFGDIEMCLRIHRHGYRIVYTPFATFRHDEGATRGSYYPPSDTRRALEQLHDLVASGDPYFHPGLSHESLVPSLPRRGDRPREVLLKHRTARASMP